MTKEDALREFNGIKYTDDVREMNHEYCQWAKKYGVFLLTSLTEMEERVKELKRALDYSIRDGVIE